MTASLRVALSCSLAPHTVPEARPAPHARYADASASLRCATLPTCSVSGGASPQPVNAARLTNVPVTFRFTALARKIACRPRLLPAPYRAFISRKTATCTSGIDALAGVGLAFRHGYLVTRIRHGAGTRHCLHRE